MQAIPGQSDVAVQIMVPQQVHLASGLWVGVPGQKLQQGQFIRCGEGRCEAQLRLNPAQLRAWKRARAIKLTYRTTLSSAPLTFEMSLMGLTAALSEVNI